MRVLVWMLCLLGVFRMSQAMSAQTLNISACPAQIVLQQSGGIKEPVLVQPYAHALAKVHLVDSAQGWLLSCQAAPKSSSGSATTGQPTISGVHINRAIGPGAVAVQNIGGKTSVQRGEVMPTVSVQLPTGWRLLAKAWSGSLRADGGTWITDAELANGDMQFSRLQDSQITVDVGSVSVQELTGRFVAHLRGAGSIEVANMRDPALDVQLSGAGSMVFKGRAASARVRASGAGHIDIEHVATEPWIQISGSATVDVGR